MGNCPVRLLVRVTSLFYGVTGVTGVTDLYFFNEIRWLGKGNFVTPLLHLEGEV